MQHRSSGEVCSRIRQIIRIPKEGIYFPLKAKFDWVNFTIEGMEDPNTADEVQQPFPYGKKKPHNNIDEVLKKFRETTIQEAEEDRIRYERSIEEKDKTTDETQGEIDQSRNYTRT